MLPPRPRRPRRRDSSAKGREVVRYAKAILEARGCRVEEAQNVLRWWPADDCPRCHHKAHNRRCPRCGLEKPLAPHSVHHDFFGCWDLLAVESGTGRHFFQVTTRTNWSHRRVKVLAAGPWGHTDAILAYVGGRGRHFEVFWGPHFTVAQDRWELVPVPKPQRRLPAPTKLPKPVSPVGVPVGGAGAAPPAN